MTTVLHVSLSVDGFATGPDDDLTILHGWAFGDTSMAMHPDVAAEFAAAGAVVFGARTLRTGDAWGDEEVFSAPVFVVTHDRREPVQRNGALFTFVGSVEGALAAAKAVAGDKDVMVMGSANVAQQLLALGLIDVLELAVTAVMLGEGIRLFDGVPPARLEIERVLEGRRITHLRYRFSPADQPSR
ncbi:dihydrofolate reductase family protein [soil metagenome]